MMAHKSSIHVSSLTLLVKYNTYLGVVVTVIIINSEDNNIIKI